MESLLELSGIADAQAAFLVSGLSRRRSAQPQNGAPVATRGSRCGMQGDDGIDDLVAVLTATYPVVRRLLWDDTFERVTRAYAAFMLTQSPTLLAFGTGFPQFLRCLGDGAAADYLADVAALESACARARHAPTVRPLDPKAVAAALTDAADARLSLHPSLTLIASRFPIIDIWETVRCDVRAMPRWRSQWALVARPALSVEVSELAEGAYEFLLALSEGWGLRRAAACAAENARGFELADGLAAVTKARVVTGVGGGPEFQSSP